PVRQQIEIICEGLNVAWRRLDQPGGLMTGAEKARAQAHFIQSQWASVDISPPESLKEQALAFTKAREQAYEPSKSVLVHGDAHTWNTLSCHEAGSATPQFKFVDPDGLFAEPACDLAISLREWREELLAGNTLELGQARCALLSELTNVDAEAIWQWGFIEHVSCGLLDVQLGDTKSANEHFAIAQCWLDA
ncbi:MAG: phosphotransferase, partial [Pseudomonadota bacterium]